MRDIDKLKKLFDEFGIGYENKNESGKDYISCTSSGTNIEGFRSAYAEYMFDKNGNFDVLIVGF